MRQTYVNIPTGALQLRSLPTSSFPGGFMPKIISPPPLRARMCVRACRFRYPLHSAKKDTEMISGGRAAEEEERNLSCFFATRVRVTKRGELKTTGQFLSSLRDIPSATDDAANTSHWSVSRGRSCQDTTVSALPDGITAVRISSVRASTPGVHAGPSTPGRPRRAVHAGPSTPG